MARRHAYTTYKELKDSGSDFAQKFVNHMKKNHPNIYKKELEPYVN